MHMHLFASIFGTFYVETQARNILSRIEFRIAIRPYPDRILIIGAFSCACFFPVVQLSLGILMENVKIY